MNVVMEKPKVSVKVENRVVEKEVIKEVEKTKFGVTIDNILGDVDENGTYVESTSDISLDLTGIKSVEALGFSYQFYNTAKSISVYAPDIVNVGNSAFSYAFAGAKKITARFDSIEQITSSSAFDQAFYGGTYTNPEEDICFPKLKVINSSYCFRGITENDKENMDYIFPVLEEISGSGVFQLIPVRANFTYSKVKKIVGSSSKTSATFYVVGSGTRHIYLPSATDVTRYVEGSSSSYIRYLHFAVANKAAIEACSGYEYLFGATEIYFDLMLTIVVSGVTYSRHQTIDGYTSWVDESGNIVYTDATAEPAVGTVVYSDQGTTQVGTVEGVA